MQVSVSCLVVGDDASKAFIINISPARFISDLREQVSLRLQRRLHVSPEDLELFRVNEHLAPDDSRLDVFLNAIPQRWPVLQEVLNVSPVRPLKKISSLFAKRELYNDTPTSLRSSENSDRGFSSSAEDRISDSDDDEVSIKILVRVPDHLYTSTPHITPLSPSLSQRRDQRPVSLTEPPPYDGPYESSLLQVTSFFEDMMTASSDPSSSLTTPAPQPAEIATSFPSMGRSQRTSAAVTSEPQPSADEKESLLPPPPQIPLPQRPDTDTSDSDVSMIDRGVVAGHFGFPGVVPGRFRAVLGYVPTDTASEMCLTYWMYRQPNHGVVVLI
ncbi:hypothetical protein HK096_005923 [Nowakowskiella sp. JEL0078]|nr:hypothetical protein HK096_005923 [Nowakowskiella sp. JEL0078]